MPISCLLPCADPRIFVRRGGGPRQSEKKKNLTTLFVCFLPFPQLILQIVNFKKNIIFHGSGGGPNLSRGGSTFSRGGGGGSIAYSL